MNRLPYFSHYRLMILALGLIFLTTSCKQFIQSNFPPARDEITAPGGFDLGMELESYYLICPIIPNTAPVIPPGPYDEELGDCALRGKSAEIETWLTELELIAASCQANRDTNWAATLAARDYLDANIDEFEVIDIEFVVIDVGPTITPPAFQSPGIIAGLPTKCPDYRESISVDIELAIPPPRKKYYTGLLISIGEDVVEYCTKIDELIKPLWRACDEINFYQECQAPNWEEYHSIIESGMNESQTNYDNTENFYTNTLQTDGWDRFRSSFNEDALDCPPIQAFPSSPSFTFDMNAFCREGPSSEYEEVATFLEGQVVQIVGRNHHEPRWWVIPNPGARGQCWVSDSTGVADGPLEELVIVAAPPLVINKPSNDQSNTCSKDLGSIACTAAGGTMGGAVGKECICPK
jgi:hypothetical protein